MEVERSSTAAPAAIQALCDRAFGVGRATVVALRDVNRGRGAFSEVLRAELSWVGTGRDGTGRGGPEGRSGADEPVRPRSVVAKLPLAGPNGEAAVASGAYRREALAYRMLLADSPIDRPRAHLVVEARGTCTLLLEDLSAHRFADQLDGLGRDDALAVAGALARFHRWWSGSDRLAELPVRRNAIAGLDPQALRAGLRSLERRWAGDLDDGDRRVLADLVEVRPALIERFDAIPPTLCHGDPRADNLVFRPGDGGPVLFDWQQMAVQFGEADLAWLAATSLTPAIRRAVERDLVAEAGGRHDRYRLGLALPGLAVLLLAQRELVTDRGRRLVARSLQRIVGALRDNETVRLG